MNHQHIAIMHNIIETISIINAWQQLTAMIGNINVITHSHFCFLYYSNCDDILQMNINVEITFVIMLSEFLLSQIEWIPVMWTHFLVKKSSQMSQIYSLMGTCTNLVNCCNNATRGRIENSLTLNTMQMERFP